MPVVTLKGQVQFGGVYTEYGPRTQCWVKFCVLSGFRTLALWKDLGSGSDVPGSARLWIRVMVRHGCDVSGQETLALRKELGSGSDGDGECKMVDQGYGEDG
ncbi:hypothetical protein MUG91_G2285n1 [Manis pentadactyla]|nr:hypothetical protein MUG91_G2285n1 [Manis pentadactyla]